MKELYRVKDGGRPCHHCRETVHHDPRCIVAVVAARDDRDAARESAAKPLPFIAVKLTVMRGSKCEAVASSHNMAHRIANALNSYTPNSKGY